MVVRISGCADRRFRWPGAFAKLAVAAAFIAAGGLGVASASEVKAVEGAVAASGPAGDRPVKQGSHLGAGDFVIVSRDGTAQIALGGSTRLAAAQGASLKINTLDLVAEPGKPPTLDIQAFDGAFRFISDESGDKRFTIRTPTANIELSGTAFDLTMVPGRGTRLLLYNGRTRMCGTAEDAACETAASPCAMLRTEDGKRVERGDRLPGPDAASVQPVALGRLTYAEELRENFPFLHSQSLLLEDFRIEGVDCSEDRQGGIADFAIEGSQIRVPRAIALGLAAAGVFVCVLFCDGEPPTTTNNTN